MATEIARKDDLYLTQFWGGSDRGPSIQVTLGLQFVQLTRDDAAWVAKRLAEWAGKGGATREA